MRIGIAQIDTQPGDLAQTARRMAAQATAAASREVDLLLFPVTTLAGPSPLDYGAQASFMRDVAEVLDELAKSMPCACLVPVVKALGDYPVIEVVLLRGGAATPLRFGPLVEQPSTTDDRDGIADDSSSLLVVETGVARVALAFTYEDLEDLCEYGADADGVCFFPNYGFAVDDASSALGAALGEARYADDAVEMGAWLACVGSLGGYGTLVFSGSSCVLSPGGQLLAVAPAFEEDFLVADVGDDAPAAGGESLQPELYDARYHLWQALVLGIRDFVQKACRTDVVLPLDGSISSMLLAVVATDALGPTHVHALLTARKDHPRVHVLPGLASSLRIALHEMPESEGDGDLLSDMAMVRMAALARELGAVALASQDKTGLALELCGDRLSFGLLAPLGDVYRVDVLDVARLRNTVSPVLPSLEVLDCDLPIAMPHQRRWDHEGLLEHVDAVLASYVEGGWGLSEISASLGDEELVESVLGQLRDADIARTALPNCLALTTRTLGELRMPLGLAWRDHHRDDAATASESTRDETREHDGSASRHPLSQRSANDESLISEEAVREALGLLRDLASDGALEWHMPFSEN